MKITLLVLALCLCIVGVLFVADYGSGDGLTLTLRHREGFKFELEARNASHEAMGWAHPFGYPCAASALNIHVLDRSGAKLRFTYTGSKERKRRNIPHIVCIQPGASVRVEIDLCDGNWNWPSELPVKGSYVFYAEYDFPESEYAHVWSGHIVSSPAKSSLNATDKRFKSQTMHLKQDAVISADR